MPYRKDELVQEIAQDLGFRVKECQIEDGSPYWEAHLVIEHPKLDSSIAALLEASEKEAILTLRHPDMGIYHYLLHLEKTDFYRGSPHWEIKYPGPSLEDSSELFAKLISTDFLSPPIEVIPPIEGEDQTVIFLVGTIIVSTDTEEGRRLMPMIWKMLSEDDREMIRDYVAHLLNEIEPGI